jgi:hypothetical protein
MKLALFTNPHSDKPYVGDDLTDRFCPDRLRISEWVDVEFPRLSDEARQEQLNRIETARDEARRQYEATLKRIDTQAQALS